MVAQGPYSPGHMGAMSFAVRNALLGDPEVELDEVELGLSALWEEHAPRGTPDHVGAIWAGGVDIKPDPMNGGLPAPGFAGRILFLRNKPGDTVAVDGPITEATQGRMWPHGIIRSMATVIRAPVPTGNLAGLLPYGLGYFALILAIFALRLGHTYMLQRVGQNALVDMRQTAAKALGVLGEDRVEQDDRKDGDRFTRQRRGALDEPQSG